MTVEKARELLIRDLLNEEPVGIFSLEAEARGERKLYLGDLNRIGDAIVSVNAGGELHYYFSPAAKINKRKEALAFLRTLPRVIGKAPALFAQIFYSDFEDPGEENEKARELFLGACDPDRESEEEQLNLFAYKDAYTPNMRMRIRRGKRGTRTQHV